MDTLQSSLDAIKEWSFRVGLAMNPDKAVCFGKATSVSNVLSQGPSIEVAGRPIFLLLRSNILAFGSRPLYHGSVRRGC